jgi:hypothetical protein
VGASGVVEKAHARWWDMESSWGLSAISARCPGGGEPLCVACSPSSGCVDSCNGLSYCPYDGGGTCDSSLPGPRKCRTSPASLGISSFGGF